MDLIRHAKSTGAQKHACCWFQAYQQWHWVIHRFTNVCLRFTISGEAGLVLKLLPLLLLLVPQLSTSESVQTQYFQLPFSTPHRLVNPYLQPTSDYSAGHRGVDFEVSTNDPIFAPADGVLTFTGHLVDRDLITIAHTRLGGSNLVSELEPVCTSLKIGSQVRKGVQIGAVCTPDPSYKRHCQAIQCLHFSMRLGGKYLSPLAFIGGLSPSRLLPQALG